MVHNRPLHPLCNSTIRFIEKVILIASLFIERCCGNLHIYAIGGRDCVVTSVSQRDINIQKRSEQQESDVSIRTAFHVTLRVLTSDLSCSNLQQDEELRVIRQVGVKFDAQITVITELIIRKRSRMKSCP